MEWRKQDTGANTKTNNQNKEDSKPKKFNNKKYVSRFNNSEDEHKNTNSGNYENNGLNDRQYNNGYSNYQGRNNGQNDRQHNNEYSNYQGRNNRYSNGSSNYQRRNNNRGYQSNRSYSENKHTSKYTSYKEIDEILNKDTYIPQKKRDSLIKERDFLKEEYYKKNPQINDKQEFPSLGNEISSNKSVSCWNKMPDSVLDNKPMKKKVVVISNNKTENKQSITNSELSDNESFDEYDE